MRKLIVFLAAAMFVFALAVAATADVDVLGTVTKDKDITVKETVTIDKNIKIDVDLKATAGKAGEADAVLNQSNISNYACENCAEKAAGIVGSILNNTGIVGTNQAIGNLNNQANVVAIAVDTDGNGNGNGGEKIGFANSQTAAGQKMIGNQFVTQGIYLRDSLIQGSINNNQGIVGVNQSAGNMNNQGNMVALAVSLVSGVALSEADLGQASSGNSVNEFDTIKSVGIAGSVNSNKGIVGVNQTSGNGANQLNGVSISATIK